MKDRNKVKVTAVRTEIAELLHLAYGQFIFTLYIAFYVSMMILPVLAIVALIKFLLG